MENPYHFVDHFILRFSSFPQIPHKQPVMQIHIDVVQVDAFEFSKMSQQTHWNKEVQKTLHFHLLPIAFNIICMLPCKWVHEVSQETFHAE